jgi:Zn-dependent protease with chaperone function
MIEARLFGEGLPGGGQPVRVHWRGALLSIEGEGLRWQAGVAGMAGAGFDGKDLRVDLDGVVAEIDESLAPDTAGAYTVYIASGQRGAFAAAAPPSLAQALSTSQEIGRRLDRRFRLAWALAAALVLVPLLAVGWAIWRSDLLAGWVVERIPVAQEIALGDLVLAQTRAGMRLQESGAAVEAVRAIGETLVGDSRFRYRWFVAEREELNAFAAPGGVVVVFAGLLRTVETPEELAGVLAHEIAHAELRHGMRAMVKSVGLRALVGVATGELGGGVLADAATRLTELKFSREAEREADADGLQRLLRAGVDPRGMVRFFARLAEQDKATPPAFLSTHPDSDERRRVLAAAIDRLPSRDWRALPVDWPAVRASLPAAAAPAAPAAPVRQP